MEKQLMELINDPEQFAEQSTVALQLLQKLCQQKAKTEFSYNGNTYCVICNQWIKNKSYKQLPCSHNAHIECFTNAMLKQSEYLILNELKYCCSLNAECASKVITQELLCQFFGRNKVSELQDIPNQLLIQELQQYEKIAQQERENEVSFDCQICYDNLKVNEDAITLDCEHRFCRGCITSSIQEHVNKGEYRDDQIVCPMCQASINNCIIKEWCPEEYKKIDDLRIKNFGTGQNNQNAQEKLINCPIPGCPEKFFVPHNIPFPQCPTCKNTICANGCDQGHVGKSCEEYKKKVKAVQAQGLVECPKCRVQIFKDGGCNHITCTMCKHEFCYVCGKNYKPKKLCSCPQNATFERGFNKIKSFFGFI